MWHVLMVSNILTQYENNIAYINAVVTMVIKRKMCLYYSEKCAKKLLAVILNFRYQPIFLHIACLYTQQYSYPILTNRTYFVVIMVINRSNCHFFIENEPLAAIFIFTKFFPGLYLTYGNPCAKFHRNRSTFATCYPRSGINKNCWRFVSQVYKSNLVGVIFI